LNLQHFFDPVTFTLTYVVFDEISHDGIVIDPVIDFDPPSGIVTDKSLKEVFHFLEKNKIKVKGILETHAHADHLSGSQYLKIKFPEALLGIGEKIKVVQETFNSHFNLNYLPTDGSQFDFLFSDFEEKEFGSILVKAIPTPGHTPACMSYLIDNKLFSGDALFMPDYGTGRCDFPGGSAKELYHSVHSRLYSLPEDTKVYVGHDYLPNGRDLKFETNIGESKKNNIQLSEKTSEAEYIAFRKARDQTLSAPKLLLPSIQVNIDAGKLPPKEANGVSYLKLPISFK